MTDGLKRAGELREELVKAAAPIRGSKLPKRNGDVVAEVTRGGGEFPASMAASTA